ncbi:MAG: 50S ribosomal protein L29 [Patescibacteria group bacterium]|nr:50S ribosomal protein L29 [Patescibacteria group bacterium]
MNILSITDLRAKSVSDLHLLLKETRKEAYELLINLRAKQDARSHVYYKAKKQIARILTLLKQKN